MHLSFLLFQNVPYVFVRSKQGKILSSLRNYKNVNFIVLIEWIFIVIFTLSKILKIFYCKSIIL